ncbi:hypothetical protein EYF80_020299 [Liparis tanakae]|uniref:Uncharacterized protein n=1 Tax=Liparis tanakae TaxID=230148 RepID=A0A4Z2HVZ0_9TELE|nr:hypothetical protein EYF80_020299 [Liparis tanakae]
MLEHPDLRLRRLKRFHGPGRPASEELDAGASAMLQTIFVLTVMTVTILVPAGWILGHLDEYRSRR